jgi:hypothetical protein
MSFEQWWAEYWKNPFSSAIANRVTRNIAKAAWEASSLEMKDQFDDELTHERNNADNLRQQVEDIRRILNE